MRPVAPRAALVRDGLGLASVDVVMNLFLFFIIAFALLATFTKQKAEREQAQGTAVARPEPERPGERVKVIDLPVSAGAQAAAPQGALLVELDGEGGVFLEGAPVPRSALTEALRGQLGEPRRPVVLRAFKGAALGETVELLDLINAAEPAGVSLSAVERAAR